MRVASPRLRVHAALDVTLQQCQSDLPLELYLSSLSSGQMHCEESIGIDTMFSRGE